MKTNKHYVVKSFELPGDVWCMGDTFPEFMPMGFPFDSFAAARLTADELERQGYRCYVKGVLMQEVYHVRH